MTTISEKDDIITLINVFTVEADKQQELIELLNEATQTVMRRMPGFISANFHRSLDGKKVCNYAQWESAAALETMQKNPEAQVHMKKAMAVATSVNPTVTTVVSCFESGRAVSSVLNRSADLQLF